MDQTHAAQAQAAAFRPDWTAMDGQRPLMDRLTPLDADRRPRRPRPIRPQATAVGAPPPDNDDGLFARLIGQHISPEMLGLWLVEVSLCAGLFFLLLQSGPRDGAGDLMREINRAAALALTFGFTSAAVGLYNADTYLRTRFLLINTGVGALVASPALWLVGRLIGLDTLPASAGLPLLAAKALLGWTLVLFGLRLAFSLALRAGWFVRRVVLIGDGEGAARTQAAVTADGSGFFRITAVRSPADPLALDLADLRGGRIWAVILTAAAGETLPTRALLRARERGVRVFSDTEFWETRLRRIDVDQPGSDWHGGVRDRLGGRGLVQRAGDIVLSLGMLLLTLPLMLLTAAAVACESRGPVLYKQERVGLHGRTFTLMKFRSMRRDAEARGPVWAAARDPRVTRVGGFIRLTRIDELPQLINVLRGEMSFIGPRPERPHFVSHLEQALPFYRDRLLVKPGLTGWAQVNYPYGASVEDARAKLSYDLYYVKHRGVLLDVLILLATVRVVLFQRGAR